MLTQEQINRFTIKARAQGFSDDEIRKEISRKQMETTQAQPTNQGMQQPSAPTMQQQPMQQQPTNNDTAQVVKPATSFTVGDFFKNLKLGAAIPSYNELQGKSVGGYATNAVSDVTNIVKGLMAIPGIAKSITTGETPIEDVVSQVVQSTVKDFKNMATDPVGTAYERPISTALNLLPFTQVGKAGEAAVVADNATNTASKASKVLRGVSENAASKILKASPSAYEKALESGFDINKSLLKYLPEDLRKVNLESLVGDVVKGGEGGIIKSSINDAEKIIQSSVKELGGKTLITTDELLTPLVEQSKRLASVPGNEAKVAVLKDFIDETKKLYPNGLNTEQSLSLKRIFDDTFGKAVADDTKGAAAASAQKMLANRARQLLKERVPAIKDALDTESELYTLRPILNRAYAIENTQGSLIRRGGLAGLDLKRPSTWLDFVAGSKPGISILSKADKVSRLVPELGGAVKASALTGPAVAAAGSMSNVVDNTRNPNENGQNDITQDTSTNNEPYANSYDSSNQDATSITQDNPAQKDLGPFGGLSKQQLLQLAAGQGATLKDLQEVSSMYDMLSPQSGSYSDEVKKSASELRSEYLTQTKNNGYIDAVKQFNKIKTTPNTPAGDISLIFAYMKLLDPSSVVRESEQSLAENATNLPGKLRNYVSKVVNGESLNAQQREEFRQAAQEQFNSVKAIQDDLDSLYTGFAADYGVDPKLIGIGRVGTTKPNN